VSRFLFIELSEAGILPVALMLFPDIQRIITEESHNQSAGGENQEIEEKEDNFGLHRAE
jgi:hypothetical protein